MVDMVLKESPKWVESPTVSNTKSSASLDVKLMKLLSNTLFGTWIVFPGTAMCRSNQERN